ncbi:MAG: hypothetical protein CVU97_06635 [Firmicutes bacterium HGW-Firmicutes-21]|nr:MAG: hypothetical protein CVU97_06635 [Firmicutes bacterium HGW-Firmicutes-21]
MDTFTVSLSIQEAISILNERIVSGSITGICIDKYTVSAPSGGICTVLVYEKHYYRAGNRLTLTVTIDNFMGETRVHSISGGGGEGLFRFDWGASKSFANAVYDSLSQYMI